MFGKHWTSARATVVDRRATKTTGDGMVTIYEFVVDVTTAEGETFRAQVGEPRVATNFRDPSVGEVVGVEFDPGSRKVRFDKDDPGLSTKARHRAADAAFDRTLHQPPGTARDLEN